MTSARYLLETRDFLTQADLPQGLLPSQNN
jgi:hypothetical protein